MCSEEKCVFLCEDSQPSTVIWYTLTYWEDLSVCNFLFPSRSCTTSVRFQWDGIWLSRRIFVAAERKLFEKLFPGGDVIQTIYCLWLCQPCWRPLTCARWHTLFDWGSLTGRTLHVPPLIDGHPPFFSSANRPSCNTTFFVQRWKLLVNLSLFFQ